MDENLVGGVGDAGGGGGGGAGVVEDIWGRL